MDKPELNKPEWEYWECFDYTNQKITRKSTNSQYEAKFLVVSVIENENDFYYDNKTNKLYVKKYVDHIIPVDRIYDIVSYIPTKILLKTFDGNGNLIKVEDESRTKISCNEKDACKEIIVCQPLVCIYTQLFRDCSQYPYTPYGRYINKENKETSNDLEYDFI